MEHAPAVAARTHTPARMRGSTRHAAARPNPVLRGGGGGVGDQRLSDSDAARSASRNSRARAMGGDHVGSDSVALPSSSLGSEIDGGGVRCGGRGGGVVGAFARGDSSARPSGPRGRSTMGGRTGGVVGGCGGCARILPQGMRGTPGSGLRACSVNPGQTASANPAPWRPPHPRGAGRGAHPWSRAANVSGAGVADDSMSRSRDWVDGAARRAARAGGAVIAHRAHQGRALATTHTERGWWSLPASLNLR